MRPLRVLVIDDSVVMRRMVRDVLSSDADIEVVGVAANGRIGLAMIEQCSPDAITLDIEMPEMDGLEMLRALRPLHRQLRVIMFSTLSEVGAVATLEALALGADDYVTKPSSVGSLAEGSDRIRQQLIPKLKALCHIERNASMPLTRTSSSGLVPRETPIRTDFANRLTRIVERVDVLIIGTSTGGPNALAAVIPLLPADLPVPVLIVQHMPATFTRFLSERLNATSHIPVAEASFGDVLEPGRAWVAPGDYHLVLKRDLSRVRIEVNQQPRENSCRPSVDVLFRSAAEIYGAHVLALVMTGMGQDGLRGCQDVRAAGGQIVVQDEASSVVWGMPGFVAKAGLADDVLPLSEIATALIRRIASRRMPSFITQPR